MLLRQLFDSPTSTYTYILADETTREAILIDSVIEQVDRDVTVLQQLELKLVAAIETHVHADHITGGGQLRARLSCKLGVSAKAGVLTAELRLVEGDKVPFGSLCVEVLETPGHTDGCLTFYCRSAGIAFTGDALLIRGSGRTDFQQGDSRLLFRSVREKIFTLPDVTVLCPGHDYKGWTTSTVAEEKKHNTRLSLDKTEDDFVRIMSQLNLPYPRRIDVALPANMSSGMIEPEPLIREDSATWAAVWRTAGGAPSVKGEWLADHLGDSGHLPGAELVSLVKIAESCGEWDKASKIITVCMHGARSSKASQILAERGFQYVAHLHGGMQLWREEGRAVVEVLGDRNPQ